jgi:hypothetical protein
MGWLQALTLILQLAAYIARRRLCSMTLSSYKPNALTLPLLLAMMLSTTACTLTTTTLTAETDAQITSAICTKAWRPVTYSSRDTEETQREARANNAARDAYCKGSDQ